MNRGVPLGLLSSALLGVGFLFLASPFALYWWIHGDYERYVWIISGPPPFDSFGGGPFQALMYGGLFLIGLLLMAMALAVRVAMWRSFRVSGDTQERAAR